MSRRPAALTILAVLCLAVAGLAAPLLAAPARAFGEHVFQANPIVGAGDPFYGVYSGATLAQSFQVSQGYVLSNVTLRVRNDGGTVNALVVSIHPDDPIRHVPVLTTQLASTSQVTPNNQPAAVNYSFPFNPSPVLQDGNVYWVVAQNVAPQSPPNNGYEWHESNGDTYANGSAYVLDPNSGVWTGLPYDLYFVTYGRQWASNVTIAMTANRTQAQPGDPVTFTVGFNNTGTQAAPWVWVNTTLPSELMNVSVGFPNLQPVSRATFPRLAFQNVGNGPHSFTIAAQIVVPTAPGTAVVNRASVDFQNATGTVVRGLQANATLVVGLATKQLYLGSTSVATKLLTTTAPISSTSASSTLAPGAAQPVQFILSPPLARPFVAGQVTVNLWGSTQKLPPQSYRLNVSLLDNGTPVASLYPAFSLTTLGYHLLTFSFGSVGHTFPSGSRIGLSLWSLGGAGGSTDGLVIRYNSTGYPAHLDLQTTTYVSIDRLALTDPVSNGTVWSPSDPIAVQANVSDPFGSGKIVGAWINITSPTGGVVAAAMNVLATDPSGLPAWSLYNYTLLPPLQTGEYRVDVTAMEDNGVIARNRADADVAAPVCSLEDKTSVGRAQAGGAFAYYLYYNNTGTGPAGQLWLNETLPTELSYVASSLPYTSVAGQTYTWALAGVPVGPHMLEIDVQVPPSNVVPAWIQDSASLVYTDGSGHFEQPLSASAVVFLNGPILTLRVASTPAPGIHDSQPAIFQIGLRNTGADSGSVWVNDTLPADFTYQSDTSASLGGTLSRVGAELQFHFAQIPAGANWTFEITAQAGPALLRNASYVDAVGLDYASTNGYLMPPESASVSLIALSPAFSDAEVTFLVSETTPGGMVPAVIRLLNSGNEPASHGWVNLSIDTRLVVENASSLYTTGQASVEFALTDLPVGMTTIYLNLTVDPNAVDGANLQMKGSFDAQDGYGNSLPTLAMLRTLVLVSGALLSLSVTPTGMDVEAGMVAPLMVTIQNFGSANASNAWLNVTVPGPLEYLNDTSGTNPTILGTVYSYHWTAPSPVLQRLSTNVFLLNLRARAATPNGTTADIDLHLDYQDVNLLARGGLDATVHARVVAPTVVLRVEASASGLFSGGTMNYSLLVSNRGLTVARSVFVEDEIDPRLSVVSYTSNVPAEGTRNLTWNFTDLSPGESETINLTVRAADGLAAGTDIANSIEATYTNSAGVQLASIRSIPVTVRIGEDLTPLAWILGVAAVFGAGLVVVLYRRPHEDIEDVFLVYRDGVLISHLSRTLLQEKDEDVLSGMLTAVQEFVREAFQYGEHRELQQLDFGDYRILIERGKYVYLAVVYAGEESPAIHRKVRAVIDLIEKEFGTVLAKWDGDMEEVVGARELIRDTLLGSNNHNHTERTIPQYE